jgi:hypothetical protein
MMPFIVMSIINISSWININNRMHFGLPVDCVCVCVCVCVRARARMRIHACMHVPTCVVMDV